MRFFPKLFASPAALRRVGIIGINQRNAEFVLPENPRKFYDRVDSKLTTKKLALAASIPTPTLYGVIRRQSARKMVRELALEHGSLVIKPNRGSGGKGILVLTGMVGDNYRKASGVELGEDELRWHISNILGGLFSLGGHRDFALVEECVYPDPILADLSFQGSPDLRIIVFRGYPVMAMLRVATRKSDGRANLHQGALGLGIDLATGLIHHAYASGGSVTEHPDTGAPLLGKAIPHWEVVLPLAVKAAGTTGLNYVGVDLMMDAKRGPLLLETNARPGLTIQMANGAGLYPRLKKLRERQEEYPEEEAEERIAFSMEQFGK